MDAASAGDQWSRCRHPLRVQLPMPLSLIAYCSSCSQWICNDCAGFWIRDGGRQVIKTAGRSGRASNAWCGAGYNAAHWVCLCGSSGCWYAPTAVPGVAVGVFIDCRWVADRVEARRWVISATRELFREDEGVQFWPWIEEATELPPWEESLSPAGTETCLLAERSGELPDGPHFCRFLWLARLWPFHTTWVVSGWGPWEGIVRYRCSTLRMQEQFPLHAYATAGKVDSYLSNQGGIFQGREAQCGPR